jgi:hypothetical protein
MSAKSVALSLIILAASASFASAAQMNTVPNTAMGRTVWLDCSAGHGDVAQTLYIKNNTAAALAKGTKIYWTLNAQKGSLVLQSALAKNATVSPLAGPGNGGTCKADYLVK